MTARWILIAGAVAALVLAPGAHAAAGDLDPSFGGTGEVSLASPDASAVFVNDVVVTRTGTAVAVGKGHRPVNPYSPGDQDVLLTGVTDRGVLDASFANGGYASVNEGDLDAATSAVQQSDGNIVVVGTNSRGVIWLARFFPDGGLDTSFGGGGTDVLPIDVGSTRTTKPGLAVDGIDSILVATADSRGRLTVVRRRPDGGPDRSFSGDGIATPPAGIATTASSRAVPIAAFPDGRVVVGLGRPGGYSLFRYTPLGQLDTSFGRHGVVASGRGKSFSDLADLAVRLDGDVVVGGWTNRVARVDTRTHDYPSVARFNAKGKLDRSFGDGGTVKLRGIGRGSKFEAIVLPGRGQVIAVGSSSPSDDSKESDVLVARFTSHGKLDRSFGGKGFVTTDLQGADSATGVALAPDGGIVVSANTAGRSSQALLLRYRGQ
jgi:uncharacterized delta-60 repeat protein